MAFFINFGAPTLMAISNQANLTRFLLNFILGSLLLSLNFSALAQTPNLTPVKLQLKWQHQFQFAGFYMAKAQGYYREAGLDVEFLTPYPDSDPIQSVMDGRAEFGVGTSELLLRFANGEPVRVLGVIFQHSPLALATTSHHGIDTVHDLVGKTVMIEANSSELFAYLQQEGISDKQLNLVPHSFNTQNLLENKVDAMSVYTTSETYDIIKQDPAFRLFSPRASGIDFYGDNLFTTQQMIDSQPEVVEAFKKASFKGWRYAMEHIPQSIHHILRNYPTEKSYKALFYEAKAMQNLMRTDLIEPGYMTLGRWQHISNTYHELGLVQKKLDLTDFLINPQAEVQRLNNKILQLALGLAALGLIALFSFWLARRFYRLKTKLNTILNQSPIPIILLDDALKVIDWNQQATETFGWKKSEVLNQNILDFLVPPSQKPLVQKTLDKTLSNKQNQHIENKNYTKNQGELTCHWSNAQYTIGKESFIICMAQDMSEIRKLKSLQFSKHDLHSSDKSDTDADPKAQTASVIAETMTLALSLWQETTQKTKIQLAEESKLWRVSLDGSTAKTRTLDKYLSVKTFPKNPRLMNVIQTANFVLQQTQQHPNHPLLCSLRDQLLKSKSSS